MIDHDLLKKADPITGRRMVELMAAGCLSLTYSSTAFAAKGSSSLKGGGKAKSLITIYASGGMSHVDSFDIKEANKAANSKSDPIKTKANGIRVGKYFKSMAKYMDSCALVNSMQHNLGVHIFAGYLTKTSYEKSATTVHPELGGWVSKHKPSRSGDIPPFVKIGGGTLGNGFFPGKYGALPIGDPNAGVKNVRLPNGINKDLFNDRLDLTNAMNSEFSKKLSNTMTKDYHTAYEDAVKLMNSKDLEVFNLSKVSAKTRETYGKNSFGTSCLLARRLVEKGINSVSLNLGGWDDHYGIYEYYGERSAKLDQGVGALIGDLKERGLLDTTIIAIMTEFGRDANINGQGGRGHNPRGYTQILAGGGIQGGQQYGSTDKMGQSAVKNIVSPGDFHATIGYAMGIDTNFVEMSPTGRPFTLGNKGKPITALF
ncbi:MAG: DUF1501 domain-containing protein [Lentisphaeraceae bacterium]|nr:DUF1501 domain-containing protein [Lentisphaeraceae bacterium]